MATDTIQNESSATTALQREVAAQTELRRTFAIISHPDAGKTTLTEKLLLYSGMIRTAGMVRARKGGKATSSDWMALEQERGISISASAMQFHYKDAVINVLDTPGHQDFSEDTYRTLTAADCAVMVLDAGNGVEAQTRKLFAVCRMRGIPIMTFINKMDLPSKEPLALLQEVEDVLGIQSAVRNFPIGSGPRFKGVFYPDTRDVFLFNRSQIGGAGKAALTKCTLDEFLADETVDEELRKQVKDDLELLEAAGTPFDHDAFLAGKQTPVFFGSALTNFGVEPFFDEFVKMGPRPRSYVAKTKDKEIVLKPDQIPFSGYVFKIQANMNPKHRDSMAYLRVCTGAFERDLVVKHHRSGKEIRLSRSYTMVAKDRETIERAYPGDIVGVINPGVFAIGDTVSVSGGFDYLPMPQFPPEVVAQLRPTDVLRHKAFEKGVMQLAHEGAVSILRSYKNPDNPPYVAAVGKLQFEVLQYRLSDEYGVSTEIDLLPYRYSLYVIGDVPTLKRPQSSLLCLDAMQRVVLLLSAEWEKQYVKDNNPPNSVRDFAG